MRIEHRTTDGLDDRIEWWDKEDFHGRVWRLSNRKVRAGLECGLCSGSLDYPCPVWRGYPHCRACYNDALSVDSERFLNQSDGMVTDGRSLPEVLKVKSDASSFKTYSAHS